MKLVLAALLYCFVLVNGAVHRAPVHSTGSLKSKLIKEGTYKTFLRLQEILRNKKSGQQPLLDYYDETYVMNITLGTPPQSFSIFPDTGAADSWVIDALCRTDACKGFPESGYAKHRYVPLQSSSYVNEGEYFQIDYLIGTVSGYLAYDTFRFAGLEVKNQMFGVAESVADVFGFKPYDGYLGLAWPSISVHNVTPVMQNLLPQLDKPLFTVWLDRRKTPTINSAGGMYTFGALDYEHCSAKVDYVPLISKTYWMFILQKISIGTYSATLNHVGDSDSAAADFFGPPAYVNQIAYQVGAVYDPSYNQYVVSCDAMNTAPSIVLTINGIEYTVPAVEYIVDVNLGNNQCVMTFSTLEYGSFDATWLLGGAFIRTYCNVYDIGNARIGFAKAKHSTI